MKNASATLYRFMSFEEFVDMVQRKQMTLVNPSKYEDLYETEIIDGPLDKSFYSKNNSEETENLFKFVNIIRLKHTYTRSWTSISESDALWRIYSSNKTSVRIGVNKNNFESLDGIIVKKVAYVKNIREYFKNREHTFIDLITTKRAEFSHEHEVRIIHTKQYCEAREGLHLNAFNILKCHDHVLEIFTDDELSDVHIKPSYYAQAKKWHSTPTVYDIPYGEPANFIESVMLDPRSPDWFDATVKHFCDENGIVYVGKSKLYSRY